MSQIEEEIRRQMLAEREARERATPAHGAGNGASGGAYGARPAPPGPSRTQSRLEARKAQGGLMGWLAAIGLILVKIGAPVLTFLTKFKFLLFLKPLLVTGGSMFVSMWFWSMMFGWPFAVGLVFLIFVHECGHALAARMLGHPVGPMVFIPLCGAFVTIKYSRNVVEDAHIGIMGPVFGTLGGIACLVIYRFVPNTFWLALAYFNFFMNLFNLTPMPPLDGSWIAPVFSPKLLAAGVVLLFVIAPANPMIWILAFMSIPRIIRGWKAKPDDTYYKAPAEARWKYGLGYLGLAAFLGYSVVVLQSELETRRPARQTIAQQVNLNPRS